MPRHTLGAFSFAMSTPVLPSARERSELGRTHEVAAHAVHDQGCDGIDVTEAGTIAALDDVVDFEDFPQVGDASRVTTRSMVTWSGCLLNNDKNKRPLNNDKDKQPLKQPLLKKQRCEKPLDDVAQTAQVTDPVVDFEGVDLDAYACDMLAHALAPESEEITNDDVLGMLLCKELSI